MKIKVIASTKVGYELPKEEVYKKIMKIKIVI